MGTNFYWTEAAFNVLDMPGDDHDDDELRTHIGKRSAAGMYCWSCDVTLCIRGNAYIHRGGHGPMNWYATCPKCNGERVDERLDDSSTGVELGFAKPKNTRPTGVHSCSSFTWAQQPETVTAWLEQHKDERFVRDEYGRDMTCGEFMDMLHNNCPVQFTDSIGRDFS